MAGLRQRRRLGGQITKVLFVLSAVIAGTQIQLMKICCEKREGMNCCMCCGMGCLPDAYRNTGNLQHRRERNADWRTGPAHKEPTPDEQMRVLT
jgi:hypothetical protein